jgi:hypothetical protein
VRAIIARAAIVEKCVPILDTWSAKQQLGNSALERTPCELGVEAAYGKNVGLN